MNQNGKVSFTQPTDDMTKFMFGRCGFWYMFYLSSGSLDSDVRVQQVTYDADWQSIENVWDGVPLDIIEAQVYNAADGTYKTFAASRVDITGLTTGDKIYFSSLDPIEGVYIDVGETPSTAADTSSTRTAVRFIPAIVAATVAPAEREWNFPPSSGVQWIKDSSPVRIQARPKFC